MGWRAWAVDILGLLVIVALFVVMVIAACAHG